MRRSASSPTSSSSTPTAAGGSAFFLVATALDHPELQGLRRILLATEDAHGLYARFGFDGLAHPERWMQRGVEPSRVHDAEERR